MEEDDTEYAWDGGGGGSAAVVCLEFPAAAIWDAGAVRIMVVTNALLAVGVVAIFLIYTSASTSTSAVLLVEFDVADPILGDGSIPT